MPDPPLPGTVPTHCERHPRVRLVLRDGKPTCPVCAAADAIHGQGPLGSAKRRRKGGRNA